MDKDLSLFKIFAPTMVASRDEASGKLRIEGVASSTVRDHHGDQLTLKALEKMAQSARGLTIFMNHSYNVPKDVFGRVEKVALRRSGQTEEKTKAEIWDLHFGIVVTKSNPDAIQTFEQIEDGTRLGLSIGAMIPDGGAKFSKEDGGRYIVDDIELVETSVVGVPANPRSWIDYAVKGLSGKFPEKLDKERATMREVLEAGGAVTVGEGEVRESPGTGEEMTGIEAPADGTETELVVPEPHPGEIPAGEHHVTEGDPLVDGVAEGVVEAEDAEVPAGEPVTNSATVSTTGFASTNSGTFDPGSASTTFIPSITASRVTVWDGDKVVEVDTGRSKPKDGNQSAQVDPETAGGSSDEGEVTKETGEVALTAADTALQSSRQVIASLAGQLAASRAETDEVREDLAAAVELAQKAVEGTALILEQLSATPMGRKTGFVDAEKSFTKLRDDIYGADFQKLLTKG